MKAHETMTELRALSSTDLQARLSEVQLRLLQRRLAHAAGRGGPSHQLVADRKEIARIKTVLRTPKDIATEGARQNA